MSLFDWLKPQPRDDFKSLQATVIRCRDNGVELKRPWQGAVAFVELEQLRKVAVRTTDAGPFEEDVFFVLFADEQCFLISQESAGTDELLRLLQGLPGFDNQALIDAMCCADNREFLCWEKR